MAKKKKELMMMMMTPFLSGKKVRAKWMAAEIDRLSVYRGRESTKELVKRVKRGKRRIETGS